MQRAYSFLNNTAFKHMPNPFNQPVWFVRVKGQEEFERQPARSMEEAVRKFVRYANVRSGSVVEALAGNKDPAKDKPSEFRIQGQPKGFIK